MEQRLNAEEFCIDKDFVFIVGTVVSFGFLGFEGLHSGGSFDCSPFVVEFRTLDMCFFLLFSYSFVASNSINTSMSSIGHNELLIDTILEQSSCTCHSK